MKQYHEHLEAILKYGSKKDPAREGMPGSLSLFGYQNRYDLSKGFPIVTTKKINFKNIVVELLWILKGDTNTKFLVDNGCNIWNEDAYNYYKKLFKSTGDILLSFEEFIRTIQLSKSIEDLKDWSPHYSIYNLGDCGKQYGWLWRNWEGKVDWVCNYGTGDVEYESIDQIKNLIEGLKSNPEGRRHIITAWNPATLDDMALNACHSFVQFNCRKLTELQKRSYWRKNNKFTFEEYKALSIDEISKSVPEYYLDCQMYQRSADMFLGVPYNISSYALLTEIIAKICNMIPGDFIHSFGDSHIYDNHMNQVKELLTRDTEKYQLPKLKIDHNVSIMVKSYKDNISGFIEGLRWEDFQLEGYQSYPTIKGKLSTGLK